DAQHLLAVPVTRTGQREGLRRKRASGLAVNHQPGDDLVPTQFGQVFGRVELVKLTRQESRILRADGEAQQVARVAEDGGAHVLRHLSEVLVGQREVQVVLARLGENLDETRGGEVLELVDRKSTRLN